MLLVVNPWFLRWSCSRGKVNGADGFDLLFDWCGGGFAVGMVERMGETVTDSRGVGDFIGGPVSRVLGGE